VTRACVLISEATHRLVSGYFERDLALSPTVGCSDIEAARSLGQKAADRVIARARFDGAEDSAR